MVTDDNNDSLRPSLANTAQRQAHNDSSEENDDDDEQQQLAEMMKRLGLPTEFGPAKRYKQQPPQQQAAPTSSPTDTTALPADTTENTADDTTAATHAAGSGRGSKAQRRRRREQHEQQQQRWTADAGKRWQSRANRQDHYDNPSYVGTAVTVTEADAEKSEEQAAVRVVWEEEARQTDEQRWEDVEGERPLQHVDSGEQMTTAADDYQSAVSLYPHGYGRFAEQTNDEEDDDEAAATEEGDETKEGNERGSDRDEEEEEEEHLDDFGLLQGEVLEGEDHTDAPIDPQRKLRGLPLGQGKRVQLDEQGNEVVMAEQTTESQSTAMEEQPTVEMDDERPDELPVVISRSPLSSAPLPEPVTALPPVSLPPTSEPLPPPPTAATAAASQPVSPPQYPLSLLPPRFHPMDILRNSREYSSDRDDEEYVRSHSGEVIEGEDRTAVVTTSSAMRGVKPRNKRVVFGDDGQIVAAAQPEQTEQGEQKDDNKQQQQPPTEQETENAETKQEGESKEDETPTSTAVEPSSDPNLTDAVDPKYYAQRYRLFSRYDAGVRIDAVGWYSVTPEHIAVHQASRIAASMGRPFTVVDAFAGIGGNTIAFALQPLCQRVIAVELDPHRLSLAQHNAAVYGVDGKCEWIAGDYLALQSSLSADVLFLAPPWGGVHYTTLDVYHLTEVEVDGLVGGGKGLIEGGLRCVRGVEGRVAVSLPRNVDVDEVVCVGGGSRVEVEYNRCNWKVKTVTAYYGSLVKGSSQPPTAEVQQSALSTVVRTLAQPLSMDDVVLNDAAVLSLVSSYLAPATHSNSDSVSDSTAPRESESVGGVEVDKSLQAFSACSRLTHSLVVQDSDTGSGAGSSG